MEKKLASLEKRVSELEKNSQKTIKRNTPKSKEDTLTLDLDNLMQDHRKRFDKGIFFSGLAMPTETPDRLIRWSCSGGFKNNKEFNNFLNFSSAEDIAKFCSNFSTPEKIKIIRILIEEEALSQKKILELTGLTQGQFYHHVKELIANKLIRKVKQDKYDLTSVGHVMAMSFIGIINSNCDLIK